MKLCSVLIPTYHRTDMLSQAIDSIFNNAHVKDRIEAVVRATDSDTDTIDLVTKLKDENPNIILVVGERRSGYNSLCEYHNEAFNASSGEWIWQFNDDVIVLTPAWDNALALWDQSNINVILTPELHRLGASGYKNDKGCPFFFQHRSHWEQMYDPACGAMSDYMAFGFAKKNNHQFKFLPIGVHHLRPTDAEIQRVRAL